MSKLNQDKIKISIGQVNFSSPRSLVLPFLDRPSLPAAIEHTTPSNHRYPFLPLGKHGLDFLVGWVVFFVLVIAKDFAQLLVSFLQLGLRLLQRVPEVADPFVELLDVLVVPADQGVDLVLDCDAQPRGFDVRVGGGDQILHRLGEGLVIFLDGVKRSI